MDQRLFANLLLKVYELIPVSIIEDEQNYREGLEDFINASGEFTVLNSYPSGEAAFPHIIEHPPAIAVVDIKLPGVSGVDLIYRIKKMRPEIQCMVCSFYDDNLHIFNALRNGASGYILKDAMAGEIIDSLRELYNGGAPMSRYIAKKVIGAFQEKQELPKLSELSERENEILHKLATGMSVKELALEIHLSAHTVNQHLKNIYTKLHVNNRIEAVNKLKNQR